VTGPFRRALCAAGVGFCLALGTVGAAHAQAEGAAGSFRKDPFESFNRRIFSFNESVDEAVLKPVAQGYQRFVPELVRQGVDNVLGNLGDVWSAVNQLLQGKVANSASMTMRVLSNTTFGLGGLFDPATLMGLERQTEDMGQTLGRWGVPAGPYVVLPLLGPSTVRDTAALPVDSYFGPSAVADNLTGALGITGLRVISLRAGLLGASQMLDGIALDKYTFMRDLYLARRRSLVYDGEPPEEPEEPESTGLLQDDAPPADDAVVVAAPTAGTSAPVLP
jgi:phospholipid-binding lipoprotein MlaA